VEGGASVVIIEHNLDIIKSADWVIDLGPEGGDAGGRVVAVGTPEQVARNNQSYTGKFLAKMLNHNRDANHGNHLEPSAGNGSSRSTPTASK
jgi:excinuclease ABC subunit A